MRCVTWRAIFCQALQNGKFAAPVMTLAKKIGIPVMLVDIRMEASHQELPGLDLLRHGTERALQWLFERYWQGLASKLTAHSYSVPAHPLPPPPPRLFYPRPCVISQVACWGTTGFISF